MVNPTKEGKNFVGHLCMSVEGFENDKRVCTFDVPVTIIAPDNVKHLDHSFD
jgi:hypothetical protein